MAKQNNFNDMPHSLEAEQALLGCLLIDEKIQTELSGILREEDFYAESHRNIFHALDEIFRSNKTADLVTLTDRLEKEGLLEQVGGIDYLTDLLDIMPSSANYGKYLDIVKRDSTLRKLIRGSSSIIEDCKSSVDFSASLNNAEKVIYDIAEVADTGEMVKLDKVIPSVMNQLDSVAHDKSTYKGLYTGLRGIDRMLNGFHKSDLVILAARPAVGKTSLAMNIVERLSLKGASCAVFSLEMSKEQLALRVLCSVAGVSMSNASRGIMTKAEWLRVVKAKEILADAKIYIEESSIVTPREILSQCRRLKRKNGLDFVMIDYMQLMTAGGKKNAESRQQEISEISRELKIMAKELNVPVLVLSQLSRAVETRGGRPQLADLRESGSIEQDADIVMFIHRPDRNATDKDLESGAVQKNVAEILIEKHRNGETGVVKLYFNGETTTFQNLSENGDPEDETPVKKALNKSNDDDFNEEHDIEELKQEIKENNLPDMPPEGDSAMGEGSIDDQLFSK